MSGATATDYKWNVEGQISFLRIGFLCLHVEPGSCGFVADLQFWAGGRATYRIGVYPNAVTMGAAQALALADAQREIAGLFPCSCSTLGHCGNEIHRWRRIRDGGFDRSRDEAERLGR